MSSSAASLRRRTERLAVSGSAEGSLDWLARFGLAAVTLWLCLWLYLRILMGRARLDMPAFAAALRQSGLSILPAMTLVSAVVGVILGRQVGLFLEDLNLPGLLLFSLGYLVVIELVPLLVGILVAGRAGVALAVRHATLVTTGKADGLLVCGVNPIEYSTAPALLAMLLMAFAFTVWGVLVTFASAAVWLALVTEVPPALFMEALQRAIAPGDLAEALTKPLLFTLVIALIGTVNGSTAGRAVEGIERAATSTMIASVTSILLIDLAFVLMPGG